MTPQPTDPVHIRLPPISWRQMETWLKDLVVSPPLKDQLPAHLKDIRARQPHQTEERTWRELLTLIAVFADENYSITSCSEPLEGDPLMP